MDYFMVASEVHQEEQHTQKTNAFTIMDYYGKIL